MAKKSTAHKAKKESPSAKHSARNRGGGKGSGKAGGSRNKIPRTGMTGGKEFKKKGCAPKSFMLLLPFIAAGAYLLLR